MNRLRPERSSIRFLVGDKDNSLLQNVQTALESTQTPNKQVSGFLAKGMAAGTWSWNLPLSRVEVKTELSWYSPYMPSWREQERRNPHRWDSWHNYRYTTAMFMCFLFDLATNSHLYITNSIKWEEDCEYRFSSVVYGRGRDLF
jgi:hypothetical protein